ncbi:MAG: hypothetical protein PHQ32_04165 [Firmicutes bacterium]|nr:hypothetical protein [Bacillota bacterium]
MNLFSKEKELIFKIVNGIFLIWLIAAVVITANSAIDYFVKEDIPTYQEFRETEIKNYPVDDKVSEEDLQIMYDQSYASRDVYALKSMLIGLANIVIVGGTIYILNRTPRVKLDKK